MDLLGWLDLQASFAGADAELPESSAPPASEEPPTAVEEAPTAVEPDHVVQIAESSGVVPQESESFSRRVAIWDFPMDDHIKGTKYANWVPAMKSRFDRVKLPRGRQLRNARVASICTGSSPEDRLCWLFDVLHELKFVCDNKEAAYQWVMSNNKVIPEVYYPDLKKLCESLTGADLLSDLSEIPLSGLVRTLDLFFAGISCKGFSIARTGRGKSWLNHADVWMAEAFIRLLMVLLPRFACVENVLGFLRPDSDGNGSPILRFLQRCVELRVPEFFVIVVYLLPGDLFLKFSRRRVFICFYLKEDRGEEIASTCIKIAEDGLVHSNSPVAVSVLPVSLRWC